VLARNPAEHVRAERVTSPLPTPLYDGECERLLVAASSDPRTYLLVLLVLETGLKKAELLSLRVGDFDFSNQYQPELWVRHTGREVFQDRRLKLPLATRQPRRVRRPSGVATALWPPVTL
jgi:integrase